MSSAASSPSPRLALRPEPAASVPHRPLLKPWYRVARTPGGMALEYGQVAVVFEGGAAHSLLPRLLGLLDGTRTADEVVALVGPAVEPATRAALARLAAHGLLTEGPALDEDDAVASLAAWLAAAGVAEPATAAVQVAALRVAVVGEGPVADRLPGLLASVGVAAVDRPAWERIGGQAGLVVVAPDAGELPRLEEWNESALREGVPWLQVLPPNGRFAAVGPLFVPGETACRRCFLLRRAANVEFGEELEHLERAPGAYPFPAPLAAAVAGLAAFLGLRWALGGDRMLAGALYALEFGSALALTYHRVHRVPRCPACSPTVGVAPPSPWFGESARAR